jgi:hypothetical protein
VPRAGGARAMVEFADQMDGPVEAEDVMVAMIADVHRVSTGGAGAIQDIELPEGEVGVFRPAVRHGISDTRAILGAGPERKLCSRLLLGSVE